MEKNYLEKIKAFKDIVYAGAIGDAFGYTVEFDSWTTIKNKYGDKGLSANTVFNKMIVSDDTQMTLFCLDAISDDIRGMKTPYFEINKKIQYAYLDWYETQKMDGKPKTKLGKNIILQVRRAPGITCLEALRDGGKGSLVNKINDSKGCGGVMRTAPVAFINQRIEDIFVYGMEQAAITHCHVDGYLSSGFFSSLLQRFINGSDYSSAFDISMKTLRKYKDSEGLYSYLTKVNECIHNVFTLKNDDLTSILGQGWVGDEALGIAMYCAEKANNFEECLELSTNHSGDSDSTASLAAQLYVAKHGSNSYIENHKKLLDVYDIVEDIFEKINQPLENNVYFNSNQIII